ncbi:LCP family protein [Eupransor demetentiae]|uniref:LytR-Cps2A-Psr (LCP) family (Peptidoglyca n teichoic acid transferase) (Cps2a) n=1 Tax=Eupransor demetentiae TaxID=3109584 RepID=A0ABP0EQH7_9LACO|nr:Anionic cell wall polymer biosynthesis enzyme TagV/TagU [Lactobacillaceae bacterium LMG 33000]
MDDNHYSRAARHQDEFQSKPAPKGKKPRKPKSKKKKWIIRILLAILAFFLIFGAYLAFAYKSSIDHMQVQPKMTKARDVDQVIKDGKPFSVLVLGTDVGELHRDRTGLTDSMMIVTVNPKDKKVTMTSIPRDIMVAIAGSEKTFPQKLNAAYPIGGLGASIQTVQDYLNVPIDFYALVNMKGLESLVDQVGGVSVESPLSFKYSQETAHAYGPDLYRFHKGSTAYEYSSDNGKTWSKTKHTMDGDAALAFSRMRYDDPDGDYGRQLRQRLVLKALMKKAVKGTTLANPKFIQTLSKNVETDISFNNAMKIMLHYRKAAGDQESDKLQGKLDTYNQIAYQMVPKKEKQRVTNKIRSELDLEAKETGSQFGGNVPSYGLGIARQNLQLIKENLETSAYEDE